MTFQLSNEVIKFWNEWEVRALVLLSLCLQIILFIFGSQRKYTRRSGINLIVWLAYLIADWVATLALGTLARRSGDLLHAFWGPFLLLHLGGPDTITAYSLEDNELWLRHFLELVVQVGVAFYIFIPSWSDNAIFRFIAIPVFITGIIKYGERTLVLWSSSAKQLKDSLRSSSSDHDPDFGEARWQMKSKLERIMNDKRATSSLTMQPKKATVAVVNSVQKAFSLFKKFRCLYADLILDHYERKESYSVITQNESAEYAFELIDIELGFMYDTLYTKASRIYSRFGIALRCICVLSHVFVSVVFFITSKKAYSLVDICVTYVLLLGAVFLEVYAFIILLFSDWTKLWIVSVFGSEQPVEIPTEQRIKIPNEHPIKISNKNKRWSGSTGQFNLLRFCLADISAKTSRVQKLFGIKELVEKYQYLTWEDVNVDLQEIIFKQVLQNAKKIEDDLFNIKLCKELLAHRGDNVLNERYCLDEFRWSTVEIEFDHSLLLWHIATDLCYHVDFNMHANANELSIECKVSKWLSNYMLYLLVVCPSMLPKGIGEIRYRETCAEGMKFFKRKRFGVSTKITKACNMLLEVDTDPSELDKIKGDRSLSVLFYGCRLAKQLQALNFPSGERNNVDQKWEMMSKVWVEMLEYAANHCGWKEHGQQLMKGGELLTHICLLMAHLGLSEQYQLQKQETHHHFRTNLYGDFEPARSLRDTIRRLHNWGFDIRIPLPCSGARP